MFVFVSHANRSTAVPTPSRSERKCGARDIPNSTQNAHVPMSFPLPSHGHGHGLCLDPCAEASLVAHRRKEWSKLPSWVFLSKSNWHCQGRAALSLFRVSLAPYGPLSLAGRSAEFNAPNLSTLLHIPSPTSNTDLYCLSHGFSD